MIDAGVAICVDDVGLLRFGLEVTTAIQVFMWWRYGKLSG
jgi:hypothetical protein